VRAAAVCLIALALLAGAMAVHGWDAMMGLLGGVMLAVALAIVWQIHRTLRSLQRRTDTQRLAAAEAEQHYLEVLWRIVRFAESRDRYHTGHSERVAKLAERLGRRMNLPRKTLRALRIAGRLHDLGMIAVPEKIANQSGPMAVRGYRKLQTHAEAGYEVLRPLKSLGEALEGVRHHHERMNGTGYPDGLAGEKIPLVARVLAVADAYDAITHDRPHRPAMNALAAVQELRRCTPAGYDPACVEAMEAEVNLEELSKTNAPVAFFALADEA
jgi:HD-GYP domain-containing protein (c-di-GMP phosphodiesterase class II)